MHYMKTKETMVRMRIPTDIYKRFKHICIESDLSISKQAGAIIEQFVNVQEENIKIMKEGKK